LLGFAKTLYDRVPEAYLFTITGADFSTGEGFSEAVSRRMDEMKTLIISQINSQILSH
jgi:hypothetical protein